MTITVGAYELFDGPADGEYLSGLGASFAQRFEESMKPNATSVEIFPRGNVKVDFSFTISRGHASAAAAFAFIYSHFADIPVTKEEITFADAAWENSFDGLVASVELVKQNGSQTVWRYRVVGGGITNTAVV